MIRFFTNRELSSRLDINIAKWKRWSREFLPPDPLGGMQSGFARHYSVDDAFTVFLGGHLVADHKFSIPEARQILLDLRPWLEGAGVYLTGKIQVRFKRNVQPVVKEYFIYISRDANAPKGHPTFCYLLKGILSRRSRKRGEMSIEEEQFIEMDIIPGTGIEYDNFNLKILNMSAVLLRFTQMLKLDKALFPILANDQE